MLMAHLIEADWKELWDNTSVEPLGIVYTKPEVVDFILDLAGYTTDVCLHTRRVLEPSCGDGAFVSAVVNRLIQSRRTFKFDWTDEVLDTALTATDIDEHSISTAKLSALQLLERADCPAERARELVSRWFRHLDFLLEPWQAGFDLVVGNPPYVRIEDLPERVLRRYRHLYSATTDRADLYIAFLQRGLELLSPVGILAYICANRFTKNRYGTALRQIIAQHH